jgi:hypothetical protein
MAANENPLISLPLATLVKELLGKHIIHFRDGKHCISVSQETAFCIFMACSNEHTCHVQFPADRFNVDMFGEPIAAPLVWDLNAWRASSERHLRAKMKAKAEKEERDIFEANRKIVARAILKISGLNMDQASVMAHRWLKDKNMTRIEMIGVTKLITKVEEL